MTADFPIPAGYALVPLEPTLAMIESAKDERMACFKDTSLSVGAALTRIYTAALAAAPPIAAVVGEPQGAPQAVVGEASIGFSPMWLAPIDGTPVLLYLPTSGAKFAVGQFWEFTISESFWGDDESVPFTHTPVGWMSLHVLERLAAPAPSPATDPAAVVGVEAVKRMPTPDGPGPAIGYANGWNACIDAFATSQALPVEVVAIIHDDGYWTHKPGHDPFPRKDGKVSMSVYAGSPPTAREPLSQKWINTLANQNGWDGVDGAPAWMTELVRDVESAHEIVAAPTGGAEHG